MQNRAMTLNQKTSVILVIGKHTFPCGKNPRSLVFSGKTVSEQSILGDLGAASRGLSALEVNFRPKISHLID